MTRLLATTALVATLAGAAFAQTAAQQAETELNNAAQGAGQAVEDAANAAGDAVDPAAAALDMAKTEGFAEFPAEELQGARVYAINGDDIGEIAEVAQMDGRPEAALVDVGGFLGMGEHRVRLGADKLRVMKDADGVVKAYTDATLEQLKAMPAAE